VLELEIKKLKKSIHILNESKYYEKLQKDQILSLNFKKIKFFNFKIQKFNWKINIFIITFIIIIMLQPIINIAAF
jgi:hypothetical protein